MAWIVLFIAGLLEVVWAAAMKQSDGFTRLQPSIVTLVAMLGSFSLLAWSMRVLPLGTALYDLDRYWCDRGFPRRRHVHGGKPDNDAPARSRAYCRRPGPDAAVGHSLIEGSLILGACPAAFHGRIKVQAGHADLVSTIEAVPEPAGVQPA